MGGGGGPPPLIPGIGGGGGGGIPLPDIPGNGGGGGGGGGATPSVIITGAGGMRPGRMLSVRYASERRQASRASRDKHGQEKRAGEIADVLTWHGRGRRRDISCLCKEGVVDYLRICSNR